MPAGDKPSDGDISVKQIDLPAGDVERARLAAVSVVILPRRRATDGRGIYGEATVFLAKELRAEGVDVVYLDESEDRLFEVKKSILAATLVTIALGVASSAAWDGIKALLRRNHADNAPMEITYLDIDPDGFGRAWTVRGTSKDAIDAIDKLRGEPPGSDQ